MLLSLGTFYAKSERFDPALDFFRRAITIQPNNLEALNKISTVLAEACHKMAGEERAKLSGAARQGLVGSTTPRLRGLKNFTHKPCSKRH
ncbi:hypothetical protein ADEAN_000292500 [Angomonas deanei]|uniref:Uncharacterized protein n=1 Tax=Angomonas deanei TaxID=59799 RepID=A0A7G2C6Q0_9TRYP|nr:hypothetical protein ADEAN_000292500 [Angomonas deanei]